MLFLLLPSSAFAEVSDKVPSIARLWIQGLIVGIAGFFAARYRIWVGLVICLISFFICVATYEVLSDPFVGPAIRLEQGNAYVISVYGSIFLILAPLLAGFILKYKSKKVTQTKSTT